MKAVVSISLLLATLLIACGGSGQFRRTEPVPDDRKDILAPKFREKDVFAMYFDKQITDQGEQAFDLSRQFRRRHGCALFLRRSRYTAAIRKGPASP